MTRSFAIALALLVASPVCAQDDPPETRRVEIRGADVHAAARFVAAVHDAGVWVVSPPGAPLTVTLEGTAQDAFRSLARASGVGLRRRDQRDRPVFWLANEHRLLRADSAIARGLSGGRRVDLDLEGVPAAELAGSLGAASRLHVRGAPVGALTVYMRAARSSRGLEILARLADARVSRRSREVAMRLGTLPDWPDDRRTRCPPNEAVALPCHPASALRLVGLAPEHGLLAPPRGPAAIVTVDDEVADGWRVSAIGEAGVTLVKGDDERVIGWSEPSPGSEGPGEPSL